jgi:hypothetical protein
MPWKKRRDEPPIWFNWPFVLGLLANFAIWGLVGVWIAHRRP